MRTNNSMISCQRVRVFLFLTSLLVLFALSASARQSDLHLFESVFPSDAFSQHGALTSEVLGLLPGDRIHGQLISLDLLPGLVVQGWIEGVEKPRLSDALVFGSIEGVPGGRFHFAVNGTVAAGEISLPGVGHFLLRPSGDNENHVVRWVDPQHRLRCLGAVEPGDLGETGRSPRSVRGSSDCARGNPLLIDLMVVYTPSSRTALGGVAAIEAVIDSHVDFTNAAYERSGVAHRLRLVHASEIAYVESGNSITDLGRLRDVGDGFLDSVHRLRDQFGADLVSLINTSGSAGIAYKMVVLGTDFASSAFSAIGHKVGGIVLAHEAGHNLGCDHNNGPGAAPTIFCYSFGHRTQGLEFRTIMSNSPGTYVDFFSSPDLDVNGLALGVSGDGCPANAAHNVRSLNNAAAIVAQFRSTVVPEEIHLVCRYGNVNAAGENTVDVLFINGSAGFGDEREVVLGENEPLKVSMALPPSMPVEASFVVYVFTVLPDAASPRILPGGIGTYCLPNPITDQNAIGLRAIFNNKGFNNFLGHATRPSTPAPSDLVCLPQGAQRTGAVFLQGIIDDTQSCHGLVAVTNGVVLRLE